MAWRWHSHKWTRASRTNETLMELLGQLTAVILQLLSKWKRLWLCKQKRLPFRCFTGCMWLWHVFYRFVCWVAGLCTRCTGFSQLAPVWLPRERSLKTVPKWAVSTWGHSLPTHLWRHLSYDACQRHRVTDQHWNELQLLPQLYRHGHWKSLWSS